MCTGKDTLPLFWCCLSSNKLLDSTDALCEFDDWTFQCSKYIKCMILVVSIESQKKAISTPLGYSCYVSSSIFVAESITYHLKLKNRPFSKYSKGTQQCNVSFYRCLSPCSIGVAPEAETHWYCICLKYVSNIWLYIDTHLLCIYTVNNYKIYKCSILIF